MKPQPENEQPPFPPQAIVNHGHQFLTICLSYTNYLLWHQKVMVDVRGYGLIWFISKTAYQPP